MNPTQNPIKVKRLVPEARLPERAYNSAGYDLFSTEEVTILPHTVGVVPTGIAVSFPEDHVALIWDRSGLGLKGLHRFAGVIDSDYRGEWKVILFNSTSDTKVLPAGSKVAQVIFQPFAALHVMEVEEITDLGSTRRGGSGFGSSGW